LSCTNDASPRARRGRETWNFQKVKVESFLLNLGFMFVN
jgi:hypothetical protein